MINFKLSDYDFGLPSKACLNKTVFCTKTIVALYFKPTIFITHLHHIKGYSMTSQYLNTVKITTALKLRLKILVWSKLVNC